MSRRAYRRLGLIALAGVLLAVAALVGVNVYLNSEYLPRLIQSEQDQVTVEYRFAWSIWPGRLHFEGLHLRGDEKAFTWEVEARRARMVAELSGLTDQDLVIDELDLRGVSARIVPHDAADRSSPPGKARAPASWKVRVAHLELEKLRELSVDGFVLRGRIDVEGSLEVSEGRVLSTGPVALKVQDGALTMGGKPVVQSIHGTARSTLAAADLSSQRGLALLGTLSGDADLKGEVAALDFLPGVSVLPVPIALSGAQGPVHLRGALKNGAVLAGAGFSWEAKDASAQIAGFSARGALALDAQVIEAEGTTRTRCALKMGTGSFSGGKSFSVQARLSALTFDVPNVDLSRTSEFEAAVRKALSEWPAQLSAEQVRVTSQERALEWEARLDQLSARVNLGALAQRELRFIDSSARGVSVRARPRLLQSEATAEAVKYFPPIEGLAEIPARTDAPPSPLSERAAQNPWSIHMERAQLDDLRELWVEAYRFQGSATTRGGFVYEAGGRLSVGSLTTQVKTGTLKIARWSAASDIQGELEASVRSFDVQEPEGYAYLRPLTLRAGVTAHVDDVDFVRHYPALPFPVWLGGGEGPLRAKVAVREGVVQAGSDVHYETRAIQLSTHGYRFVGPLAIGAGWANRGGEPRLKLEARVSPYRVTRVGNDQAILGGKLATLRMDVAKFDVAQPTFEPFTTAQVTDGEVYDLRALNEFVPKDLPLKLDAGAGRFTGKVAFPHRGKASAELKVSGAKGELVYDKIRLRGDWSVAARLSSVNLTTGDADLDHGLLLVDDMAMREGARAREGWFGRFELAKGKLRPRGPVLLEGDLDTTMRDGRPLIAFIASETELMPPWARTLITLEGLRATARLRLGDGLLELDRLNARGQSLELRGRVRKDGERQWADLLVAARGQQVGLALRGKRVELKLIGAAGWFRDQMLDPKW